MANLRSAWRSGCGDLRRRLGRLARSGAQRLAVIPCTTVALLASGCVHLPGFPRALGGHPPVWRFAVAGDSRNCGDVVMPAIADEARRYHVELYWHLGDFRWMSSIDDDMEPQYPGVPLAEYQRIAWGDFIAHQVVPFGSVPVFLGIGNHELYKDADHAKSYADFLSQFAYWLDAPPIRAQRLRDDASDDSIRAYYHWKQGGVDFINLDNSGNEGFGAAQLEWLRRVLETDRTDSAVHTLVVGMHRALPNSLGCGHSMNDTPASLASGRRAYRAMLDWRKSTGKRVYVLASHSHYFMSRVFETSYWKSHGGVLPGWIIGTAGARRYPVPKNLPPGIEAKADVYGYLLGTVAPDGEVDLEFKEVTEGDVPDNVVERYGQALVDTCFRKNSEQESRRPPNPSCFEQ